MKRSWKISLLSGIVIIVLLGSSMLYVNDYYHAEEACKVEMQSSKEVDVYEGLLCVLPKMPFNLAILDSDATEGIAEQYPYIENWYIGGHSLGGAMAATYFKENLPVNYNEVIIKGGCHAFFGQYGLQEGDGMPNITALEQMEKTAEEIGKYIQKE